MSRTPAWACDAPGLHFPQSTEANPGGGRGGLELRVTTALPERGSPSPGKLQRLRSSVHWLSFLNALSPHGFSCGQRRDPLCSPVLPAPPEGHLLLLAFPPIPGVSQKGTLSPSLKTLISKTRPTVGMGGGA